MRGCWLLVLVLVLVLMRMLVQMLLGPVMLLCSPR